ncbi:MAG: DUF6806 family protein [Burkholderiales bacterium]
MKTPQRRKEVHVHGTIFLTKGVEVVHIEEALKPWLDYCEVKHITDLKSIEQQEPGVAWDPRERTLDLCWTAEIGRSFGARLSESLDTLGPMTEYASEIEVTWYHENGEDELGLMFVGPTADAIQEVRRQCANEDVDAALSRYLGRDEVDQVLSLVNDLFQRDWEKRGSTVSEETAATGASPAPRNRRHLH